MQKEFKELLNILNNINEKKLVEIDSVLEKKFQDVANKLKNISKKDLDIKELEPEIVSLEEIIEKLIKKQQKNMELFDEFKNYLKKKK